MPICKQCGGVITSPRRVFCCKLCNKKYHHRLEAQRKKSSGGRAHYFNWTLEQREAYNRKQREAYKRRTLLAKSAIKALREMNIL